MNLPSWWPALALPVTHALAWIAPTPKALIGNLRYVFDTMQPSVPSQPAAQQPPAQPRGTIMPLLNLLPAPVLSFIQSSEATDDLKLAEALLAGDAAGATQALKKAILDAPIPEPYKEIVSLLASSDAFDALIAGKLIEEVAALKAAVVGN